MKESKHDPRKLRRFRKGTQIVFMVFYIISLGATPFFLLDPLAALASTIAARALISSMIMALFTVVITLMWGRVWCGWICPLGTLLDWIRFPRTRERALSLSPHWKTVKYLILFFILTGALFGSLTLMILDPIKKPAGAPGK